MPDLYDELRRIAAQTMRRERRHHTLRPTALANETYIRLARESRREWESKAQVLTAAAHVMRRILVDHARRKSAGKRGGRSNAVSYDELRHFAGMTVAETASILDVSPATVKREWALARAWLFRELSR